ncbi:MAG: flagellar basal body P-ring formation chaperone FlgA [Tepidisphaeraceae bacterium]
MNHRKLGKRKQVQLLVVLTILAWATQTLMHQWGFGQELSPATDAAADSRADEKFVSGNADSTPGGTLELRQEASIFGADVKLKQVCRWSDADAPIFTPIADLTLLNLSDKVPFHSITVDQIRQTLHEAGVNVAMINFAGATSCSITRTDAQTDSQQTVQQWLDSHPPDAAKTTPAGAPKPMLASASNPAPDPNLHTLRDLLVADLGRRLSILPETLQLSFSPQDEKVLALAEPIFKFDVRPSRARALGNVSWEVTIFTDSASKKLTLSAEARAWQDQVIAARPLPAHKVLAESDFAVHRLLVDSLPDHQLLRLDQCVGQAAAEDLRPGTVMTAQLVNAVPLVKPGQLVTITLRRGSVQLRSVARAMEEGSLGQTIRVRNENTRDTLDVTVTGAQEARLGDAADQEN